VSFSIKRHGPTLRRDQTRRRLFSWYHQWLHPGFEHLRCDRNNLRFVQPSSKAKTTLFEVVEKMRKIDNYSFFLLCSILWSCWISRRMPLNLSKETQLYLRTALQNDIINLYTHFLVFLISFECVCVLLG
jgi:hypothetical protein